MRHTLILAGLLLTAPALLAGAAWATTPAAVQADQSPTMPGAEGGTARHAGGGKLAGFFTQEQRAMFMLQAREQVKDMTQDQRRDWRKQQVQKVMAMSDTDRARMKADLQAKWDALPQAQKDRIQQRLARSSAGPNSQPPAQ